MPVTHDALAAAQADDEELRALLVSTTALQLEKILIPGTSVELYCDTSSGKQRLYIPAPLRRQIFNSLHPSVTPVLRQRLSSSPNASCGQPFRKTAALGPELANRASAPKFPATPPPQLATSPSLLHASYTSTST